MSTKKTITIPRPRFMVRGAGITAANVHTGIRLAPIELNAIDEAAENCNLTRNGFIRWCAKYCAEAVNETSEREEREEEDGRDNT